MALNWNALWPRPTPTELPRSYGKLGLAKRARTSPTGNSDPIESDCRRWKRSGVNIMPGVTVNMTPDFKEFVDALNDHDVRYLIVGAYALALHGHPRYTKDLDIWLDRSRDKRSELFER